MLELAPDVHQIPLTPRSGINAYLLGDVIVDAGMAFSAKTVVKALEGRAVSAHALTHAHVDHAGGSRRLVDALELPVWAPAGDAEDVRRGEPTLGPTRLKALVDFVGGFDGVDVDRELHEGDAVGPGFVVLDLPGHSPGQVGYWREADRVLVVGDVLNGMNLVTTQVGLHLPPGMFNVDTAQNLASARRVAALRPSVLAFGHGPVMRDAAGKLDAFLAGR